MSRGIENTKLATQERRSEDTFFPPRPTGIPIFHQRWENLLFLHWPVAVEQLQSLVPRGLEIDTFDGSAWVSVTPFWALRTRPHGLPAVPFLGDSHEVNVRTYVRGRGVPGIWFLSIDASNPVAVVGARIGFSLPYYCAWMQFQDGGKSFRFRSSRVRPGASRAVLDVRWTRAAPLGSARPGSLEFFLVERYCLYTMRFGRLRRSCIAHAPWLLYSVEVGSLLTTLLEPLGFSPVRDAQLAHAQGNPLDVVFWRFGEL